MALEVRRGELLVIGEGPAAALHVLDVLPPRSASLSPARIEQLAALARAELALVEPEHAAVERARSRAAPRPARGWWRACDVPALPARETCSTGWRGSGARPVALGGDTLRARYAARLPLAPAILAQPDVLECVLPRRELGQGFAHVEFGASSRMSGDYSGPSGEPRGWCRGLHPNEPEAG